VHTRLDPTIFELLCIATDCYIEGPCWQGIWVKCCVKPIAPAIRSTAQEEHDERVGGVLERALSLLRVPGELTWVAPSGDNDLATIDENIYHRTTCQVIEAAA